MSLRDSILRSSVRLVQQTGLDGWSIQGVATGAKCAKALVIHHFKTKQGLLEASSEVISKVRLDRRLAALATAGTRGLDRLWGVLSEDAESGVTRAAFALASHGYPTSRMSDGALLHAAVARCLGIPAESVAEPIALLAMLEGTELQLLKGGGGAAVRSAFERLWVTMIE